MQALEENPWATTKEVYKKEGALHNILIAFHILLASPVTFVQYDTEIWEVGKRLLPALDTNVGGDPE